MGRPLRIDIPNIPYHVLNRGNNKQVIFHDDLDYIYYLKLIKRYKEKFNFKLYHLSLLPNHVHLHTETMKEGDLSKIMQRLTLANTWYYNKKYGSVGHIWQGRFKNPLIDKDEYFLQCGLYIELNAVRAGLVEKAEDWRWCSYNLYAYDKGEEIIRKIIDPDPFYLRHSEKKEERQKFYREMVETVIQEEFIARIKKQFDKGVYGSEEFVTQIGKKFGIGLDKKKGRPRKNEQEIQT